MDCRQCGTKMNPVNAIMGPVCGKCCRRNQRRAYGQDVALTRGEKIRALVNEGLADDVADARAQLEDMGEL